MSIRSAKLGRWQRVELINVLDESVHDHGIERRAALFKEHGQGLLRAECGAVDPVHGQGIVEIDDGRDAA